MTNANSEDSRIIASSRRREELRRLLQERASRERKIPASSAQRRLWFISQFEKPNASYNIPCHITLRGAVDIGVLEKSLNQVIARHESLRTSFIDEKGEPFQVIASGLTVDLPFADITQHPLEQRDAIVAEQLTAETASLFELDTAPLVRARLIRYRCAHETAEDREEYVLFLVLHHIICDGWSIGVLTTDLFSAYERLLADDPPASALRYQYSDYTGDQSKWVRSAEFREQLDSWATRLAGLPSLDLPKDYPRPHQSRYRGANLFTTLGPVLSRELLSFSAEHAITPSMLLSAVFTLLLHKYCGQDDIVFGAPAANRTSEETEKLVGFFVNMQVMRVSLDPALSFLDLLDRVRENALFASATQEVPFEHVIDVMRPERDRSMNPLFQVLFAMQNERMPSIELQDLSVTKPAIPGYDVSTYGVAAHVTRFDLELHCWESEEGIRCSWVFDTDLFESSTIERMARHFVQLAGQVVSKPDAAISSISLLSPEERNHLLLDWNHTAAEYPRHRTVHELFEEQTEKTPDRSAFEYRDAACSYRELNARANRLANYLKQQGVGPGTMVGLCLERGLDMLVALLGIVKAGGTYVPLDPEYPEHRIEFMIEDAGITRLVTVSSLQEHLKGYHGDTILLDSDADAIAQQSEENPPCELTPASTLYVIYTSGSTGRPKGVPVPHRAVVCLVRNADYVQVQPEDRLVPASNISFDAATFEVWGALLNGAQLCGVDREVLIDPAAYSGFIQQQGITVLFLTTALFNLIARQEPNAFRNVRTLLFGGEAVDPRWVRRVLQSGPPQELLHMYGPTENTTFSTWYRIDEVAEDAVTVPIGRPMANSTAYVLDRSMKPVPIGVTGELYLGGDGLAHGYLNRPELTSEKFVPDPFVDDRDARLYRTGDLVRRREDGAIEFVGRIDHQVKIRGFRIEPGEVESVLCRQPAVETAAVLALDDEGGAKRLVAYVVPAAADTGVDELRTALQEELPAYMVPTAFIVLDGLPLTPNGKLDRDALPAPDAEHIARSGYVAPRSVVEKQLAGIWSEVLKIDRVGIFDNFFDLGGHSLMATQIVSRVRQQMNVELPLSEMFGYPTVAELAPIVENLQSGDGDTGTMVIPKASRDRDLPLSFAQERLWFLDKLEPGNAAYIIPLALRLRGRLRVDALVRSLDEIVRRHEVLRTRFLEQEGGPVQVIDREVSFELAQVDLTALPEERRDVEMQERLKAEALRPFDLARDLLIRGTLLRLSEQEHILLLTMHHIASDGWSLGVLFRELADAYAESSVDREPRLGELPVQYADFAVWQREWLQGEQLEVQLDYWQSQLADLTTLELQTDHPRPAMQTYQGAYETLPLGRSLTSRLESHSKESGVTLFMTMLSVYMVLLHRYSGQDDIVIGSPIANRRNSDLEDLIAFFVNMLVMRADASGNPAFSEFEKRVSETALEAFEHQDIPFEKLVEALQVERDPSRNPLFQVHFALQNAPLEPLELQGLTLEPVSGGLQTTRFDLECHVWSESDGLLVDFIYNTRLFDADTIRRMLGHYRNLLEQAMADPERPIDELPLLGFDEKQLLLEQWNRTGRDYPLDKTLHRLFEEQVVRTPHAVAVEFGERTLTYAELNERSDRLAAYLQDIGVGPDGLVGVFMERSLEMVIALYGILKSGGAYVPLDPEYPRDRIAFMIEETRIRMLLTQEHLRSGLADVQTPVQCLDSDWNAIVSAAGDRRVSSGAAPDHLAYVIYTSGSTGRPKGVMNHHRGIVNRLLWMQEAYSLQPDDRVLQKTPFSFDVSVWEFFWPLLNGARLVVAAPDGHRDPAYLSRLILDRGITTVHFVPSMLQVFLDHAPNALGRVRRVICSGEALSYELQQQFFRASGAELHNLYGPTEAAVDVTSWHCRRDDARAIVPIGRPVANTRIYILDSHMQPVPVGVPGELYIGGVQVAYGYIERPDLSREKFVEDVFDSSAGTRLYRTGDLARYLPDGNIEYLGRIDHQVKIRGLRIEPGEIENELVGHDAVQSAVVAAREDEPGDLRLVAYVVADRTWMEQIAESKQVEHVGEWQTLYDQTYGAPGTVQDPTFNIVGWNSSYTGSPIPTEEMREWVDETVDRISAFHPGRVLEIGCGTGLLLYRLAPDCDRYIGTDFSAVAQQQLRDDLRDRETLRHVELWQRMADDFSDIEAGDFDTVIINSVVQYLPGTDYLVTVLEGAVNAVAKGGRVFVGDVRSFPLLKAFHATAESFRTSDGGRCREMLSAIQQHVEEENELVIEPAFFHALKHHLPRISHVEVLLKRGRHHNELSQYRYDVVLHVEADQEELPATGEWLDWGAQRLDTGRVERALSEAGRTWLGIRGIPNARVAGGVAMLGRLLGHDMPETVDELKAEVADVSEDAVEPMALWALAAERGYALELGYSSAGADGRMDALFRRRSREQCRGGVYWPQYERVPERPWAAYGTNPLKGKLGRVLIPQLREDLKVRLPEYMVPSVFVMLDSLPLLPNGKVDRKSLPQPGDVRAGLGADFTAPRTELEEQLAGFWKEVLTVEKVGVHDSFFDLGGHSLMATRIVSRILQTMNVNMPVAMLFERPTIAEMAEYIENALWLKLNRDTNVRRTAESREVGEL